MPRSNVRSPERQFQLSFAREERVVGVPVLDGERDAAEGFPAPVGLDVLRDHRLAVPGGAPATADLRSDLNTLDRAVVRFRQAVACGAVQAPAILIEHEQRCQPLLELRLGEARDGAQYLVARRASPDGTRARPDPRCPP